MRLKQEEFQSLNLAGQGLSGLNSGTETPASEYRRKLSVIISDLREDDS